MIMIGDYFVSKSVSVVNVCEREGVFVYVCVCVCVYLKKLSYMHNYAFGVK